MLRAITNTAKAREVRSEAFGDSVGEIVLCGVAGEIGERQHNDRETLGIMRRRAPGVAAIVEPAARRTADDHQAAASGHDEQPAIAAASGSRAERFFGTTGYRRLRLRRDPTCSE